MQADSLCFDKVIMRVRRNASDNMEMMTVASTTHPILSLPTNVSLNSTLEQSDVSSRHWPATQLPPNSTLLPDKAADNATHILDILEDENHRYYRSRVLSHDVDSVWYYWVSEETMYAAEMHGTLSESYRSAVTVPLSFTFTFYGHEVKQITIATGGFLYMSEFLHQWLTATQYIAPLMANFDTQLGNNSFIRYMDNGTVFVVWWEDAYLQDYREVGPFSFQVLLHSDGRIIFSYKQIPNVTLLKIPTARHPVKVGLSDAYYIDKPSNADSRQRTIYEYHRVEINMSQVASNSAVVITPLPTCVTRKSCTECIEASLTIEFQCQWCPSVGRCSDGLDRRRQEWQEQSCDKNYIISADQCQYAALMQTNAARLSLQSVTRSRDANVAAVILVTFLIVLIFALLAWVVYAYKNPNSQSGIWLIQHRPMRLVDRIRQLTVRRSSRLANKYEVAMHPEAESLA